ncbi:unnamed protein product [Caenorhabditis auriculariae]|uniref:CBF1-interacting co-repressor CIR N-terminal domain-containing protein n=1 Tax=Caenorhabditis auriculariae TaxID=2777116 RepID=A0A8S1HJU0_9PELO|nr:unnamed protein product [Caenorhabditis auriculariae]
MNILPKKKWHVRTKENVARVRRDEAKAAEEEQRRLDRQILAQNERRLNLLRDKAETRMADMFGVASSSTKDVSISNESGHVNLFQDLEREERKNLAGGNKEYDEEKAREKKEWESKMGIQVYLADGSSELDKKGAWYEKMSFRKAPEKKNATPVPKLPSLVIDTQQKSTESERKKKKKRRRTSSSSSDSGKHKKSKKKKKHRRKNESEDEVEAKKEEKLRLAQLREERIKRERLEAARTHALLNPEAAKKNEPTKPKYNSMFNPHLAR